MSENNIQQPTLSVGFLSCQSLVIAIVAGRYFASGRVFFYTLGVLLILIALSHILPRLFTFLAAIFGVLWACAGFGMATLFSEKIPFLVLATLFAFWIGYQINMAGRTQFKNFSAGLIAFEIFIIALIAGIYTESLEFFGIVFLLFFVLVFIILPPPKFSKLWGLIFAGAWGIAGREIAEMFFVSNVVLFAFFALAFFIGFILNTTINAEENNVEENNVEENNVEENKEEPKPRE